MTLKSRKKILVRFAVVNACILVCIFFLSCAGSSGDGGGSNENNRDYMFTAWLNRVLLDRRSSCLDFIIFIKEYPPFFYLSVAGKSVEYRVMKSDMGFELKNGCISACAVIFGTDDYTDSIFIE
ncbi:MAG: hypothetical protein P8Y38_14535 [Deltaproteobacteria bacterium]